jgi:hypothetical protein
VVVVMVVNILFSFYIRGTLIDRTALADIALKLSCRDCTHTLDLLYTNLRNTLDGSE